MSQKSESAQLRGAKVKVEGSDDSFDDDHAFDRAQGFDGGDGGRNGGGPRNHDATITGIAAGTLTEDTTVPVTGTLTVIDPDHGEAHTRVATNAASIGGLGVYSVDADGHWSYTVNNALVQYLNTGQSATDSFVVSSLDGTAQQTVTVTITGANEGAGATLRTLLSFDGSNGAYPSGLIADAAGDLFGTTPYGGVSGLGTVFELLNNGGGNYTPVTLLSFNDFNGNSPFAGLIADAAGDLFGTTYYGGANGWGTVFELVNNGGGNYTPVTLVSFNSSNGARPLGGLIADAAGDLFGTISGVRANWGTVFELVNNGGGNYTPVTLHSFNYSNGAYPRGSLIADAAGDLFGTTYSGGASGRGTVFELVNNGGGNYTPVTLVSFNNSNGSSPVGGLIADAAGDLFGTTYSGGASGRGTVFELVNNGGGNYTPVTLVSFSGFDGASPIINGSNGAHPNGSLIADAAGDLFGTTDGGGAYDVGTVFELVNNGGGNYTLATLVSFDGSNGAYPSGLIADAAGDLFGTTYYGGAYGAGTVFELVNSGFVIPFMTGETWVGGNGGQTHTGTAGDDKLTGGNGKDMIDGGAGNDIIKGGNGADTLIGGLGDDSLTGGNGPDVFAFFASFVGFGQDIITDFKPKLDTIQFDKAVFASFTDVLAHTANDGHGNSIIMRDANDKITLEGVTREQLPAGAFRFV